MIHWQDKIEEQLQKEQTEKEEINPNKMRASSCGYCLRQMYLGKVDLKDFDTYVLGSMQSGTIIHEWIEETFKDKVDAEFEQSVEFEDEGVTFTGRYDCFDGEVVYDFKSQNGLNYVKNSPNDKHIDQLHVYMRATNSVRGKLVYIDKASLEVVEHTVEFDPSRWDKIKERVKTVLEEVEPDNIPEKPEEIPFDSCGCFFCNEEELKPRVLE